MAFVESADAYCQKPPVIEDVTMLVIGFNLVGRAADFTPIFERHDVTRVYANGEERRVTLPSIKTSCFLLALSRTPLADGIHGIHNGQRISVTEFARLNHL